MRYHPWRRARDEFPDWEVDYSRTLPDGVAGKIVGRVIYICSSLTQAARRSTLGHELEHVDRGTTEHIDDAWFRQREEATVDSIAARKLITLDELVDALAWTRFEVGPECAGELWIDAHTLRVRVRNLTDDERAFIDEELERRQP